MQSLNKSNISDKVRATQLQYWASLFETLRSKMPEFVEKIANNDCINYDSISLDEWKTLATMYNDAFVRIDDSFAQTGNCKKVSIEHLTVSSQFYSGMCRHHRVQEFLKMKTSGVVTLDYEFDLELISDQIHPLFYDCLSWYKLNYMHASPDICLYLRSFDMFIIPDGAASSTVPEYSPESQVVLRPVNMMMGSFDVAHAQHMLMHRTLLLARTNHIACKFCFPSELGMCAHAMDKQASNKGYPITLKNRPNAMKHVYLPENITDIEFQQRYKRLEQFLTNKSKYHCKYESNQPDPVIEYNAHNHSQCIRYAYRRYVYNLWNRIMKNGLEKYKAATNIVLLLNQFEKQLNIISMKIAENYQSESC